MRLEKCLLDSDMGKAESGKITIPKGKFNIHTKCKFIALKKSKSEVIMLIPYFEPDRVFEIYAELADGQLSMFVKNLVTIVKSLLGVELVKNTEGICTGVDGKIPCSFNGFLLVRGEAEKLVVTLKDKLINIENEGKVVVKLDVEEVL